MNREEVEKRKYYVDVIKEIRVHVGIVDSRMEDTISDRNPFAQEDEFKEFTRCSKELFEKIDSFILEKEKDLEAVETKLIKPELRKYQKFLEEYLEKQWGMENCHEASRDILEELSRYKPDAGDVLREELNK